VLAVRYCGDVYRGISTDDQDLLTDAKAATAKARLIADFRQGPER